jgi:pyruvate/2-oxoglutarate dehydrogenase complex dihydrolipoamide dehydrogenase (E3) component
VTPISENMPWDLLVVGGGTAGLVSAQTAAGLGARVALVERARTGGDCLWTGCVPSKALVAAGARAAEARRASRMGVHVGDVSVDLAEVMAHVQDAIRTIEPVDSSAALEAAGVRVIAGDLTFTGPHSAQVDGRPLAFEQAVVCTGSAPLLPPLPGLAEADPLTTDDVWQLRELPRRLAVLGGGSTGCELGQSFARLGAEVTIVEAAGRVLPAEEADASRVVSRSLARDGVSLRTGAAVTSVRSTATSGVLVLAEDTTVEFDRLLVAAGRSPRTQGLGLERAGVRVDAQGYVEVDSHLRTTSRTIWAAGDVTGHPPYTHHAGVSGSVVTANAVLGLRRRVDTSALPRVTYTQPEVASVGVSPETAGERGMRVVPWANAHVDRAVAESDVEGFTRLVVDPKGRVVGATVVGPRAGETLGELTVAVRHGLRTRDLAATMHAYPTYNDGVWNAALHDVRRRLRAPVARRATGALVTARRRWVRARRSTDGAGALDG